MESVQGDNTANAPSKNENQTARLCYARDLMLNLAALPISKRCPEKLVDIPPETVWLRKIIRSLSQQPVSSNQSDEERPRNDSLRESDFLGISLAPPQRNWVNGCRNSPQKKQPEVAITKGDSGTETRKLFNDLNLPNKQPIQGTRNFHSREYTNRNHQPNSRNPHNDQDRDRQPFQRPFNERAAGILSGGRDRGCDHTYSEKPPFHQDYRGSNDLRPNGAFDEEPEPEWLSDGPKSRFECIDLRGFEDDPASDDDGQNGNKENKENEVVDADGKRHEFKNFFADEQEEKAPPQKNQPTIKSFFSGGEQPPVKPLFASKSEVSSSSPVIMDASSLDGSSAAPDKVGDSTSFILKSGGGSRFTSLFSAPKNDTVSQPSIPEPVAKESAQKASEPELESGNRELGKTLLQLLQKNAANQSQSTDQPKTSTASQVVKTPAEIEQQPAPQIASNPVSPGQGQARMPFALVDDLDNRFADQSPQVAPQHPPQRPILTVAQLRQIELEKFKIPNEERIHGLLDLSVKDLSRLRDENRIDQQNLLTLLFWKQQRDSFRAEHAPQLQSAAPNMPPGMRGPVPPFMAHHGPNPHVAPQMHRVPPQMQFQRLPNGQIVPVNMIPQAAAPINPISNPISHHLATRDFFAAHNQMQQSQHMRQMNEEPRSPQSPMSPSNLHRPSPLLPTSVLRKTIQRGDSGNSPTADGSASPQNLPGMLHHLAGAGDRNRELEEEAMRRRQEEHVMQQRQFQMQRAAALQQQQMRNPYAQHDPMSPLINGRIPPGFPQMPVRNMDDGPLMNGRMPLGFPRQSGDENGPLINGRIPPGFPPMPRPPADGLPLGFPRHIPRMSAEENPGPLINGQIPPGFPPMPVRQPMDDNLASFRFVSNVREGLRNDLNGVDFFGQH